jgi:hypothetical protein
MIFLIALVGTDRDFLLGFGLLECQPVLDQSQHEVRVNRIGAERDEATDVVAFLHVPRLDDERAAVAEALLAQVRVNGAEREQ